MVYWLTSHRVTPGSLYAYLTQKPHICTPVEANLTIYEHRVMLFDPKANIWEHRCTKIDRWR